MAEYRLSEAADADLLQIAYYTTGQFGPRQAMIYGEGFEQCFELIADNPKVGLAKDGIRLGLRCLNHKSHAIFYIETDQGILIVRILHDRQDPARHLG